MGLFDSLFGTSGTSKNLKGARNAYDRGNQQAYNTVQQGGTESGKYYDTAGKYLTDQYNSAQNYYSQPAQSYNEMYKTGKEGVDLYGQRVGLHGEDLTAQLEKMPGYQWALGQGTQAVDRNAAATGRLASGNTDIDLTKFAQGNATQYRNQWLHELDPYFGMQQSGAAGQAGVANNQANLAYGYGQDQAGLNQNRATATTGMYDKLASLRLGRGQNNANYFTNRQNADQAANQSGWNFFGNLLNAGSKAAGYGYS